MCAKRWWPGRDITNRDRSFRTETIDVLTRIGDAVPTAIELGYHLCYGSPADEHCVQPKDMAIMVGIASAASAGVARPIQFFHMPVPEGAQRRRLFRTARQSASASRDQALSRAGALRRCGGRCGADCRSAAASRWRGVPPSSCTPCCGGAPSSSWHNRAALSPNRRSNRAPERSDARGREQMMAPIL
jgi:hypothetical protein